MVQAVPYKDLPVSDLIVDAVYESSADGRLAGEPIAKLLPGTGNMGGFRVSGRGVVKNWVVLFTTGEDRDWPDSLDIYSGRFVYFGDNKTPGHELHDTVKGGNRLLRESFASLHDDKAPRQSVSPFLIFKKYPTLNGARSVQFKGLAVPGFPGLSAIEDLTAVWKAVNGCRFQNYRSVFTLLDVPVVRRDWIYDLSRQVHPSSNAPSAWMHWKTTGKYAPLAAEPTTVVRSVEQQMPETFLKKEILESVWRHFEKTPIAFEAFAARIYGMTDQRVIIDAITRGAVDGGRDAFGRYLLGSNDDPVYAEFSLEAKCYRPSLNGATPHTVGVKEVSRLISRIRHRQFGVLVTTSAISRQAYEEVREDRHPIVFLCGSDIANVLVEQGYNTVERARRLLISEFGV